jgi:hypothetical protein
VTANQVLVLLNAILAAATLVTAFAAVVTIRSSKDVSKAAACQASATTEQATATAELAKKAGDQLRLGREALEASIRPTITHVPQDTSHPDVDLGPEGQVEVKLELPGVVLFSVPIRNVGPGPAFLRGAYLEGKGGKTDAYLKQRVLSNDEVTQIYIVARSGDPDLLSVAAVIENNFRVGVTYEDQTGGQKTLTVISVVRIDWQGGTRIYYLPMSEKTYHCDDHWEHAETPFSTVGPDVPIWSQPDEQDEKVTLDQQMSSLEAALQRLIEEGKVFDEKLSAAKAKELSWAKSAEGWKPFIEFRREQPVSDPSVRPPVGEESPSEPV